VECDECVNGRERITVGSASASAKILIEETTYDERTIIRIHLNT
jgi:hypothetical protein